MELFTHNREFKILFADVKEEEDVENLYHFNLHNGTIWRWIRPILERQEGEAYSFRLELRVLPSGPTLIDTNINLWFFIALIEGLVVSQIELTNIPFEVLKRDFYSVAKEGLTTHFHEPLNAQEVKLDEWIAKEGVAYAKKGFISLGIESKEYLKQIKKRALKKQNGASWQLAHFKKYHNMELLMSDYMKNANENIPISQWRV